MIEALAVLLRQERRAIAAIDVAALSEIGAKKEKLISALAGRKEELDRHALNRLLSEAEANRALINDALDSMREMLGVQNNSGLYDARARVREETGSLVGTKL